MPITIKDSWKVPTREYLSLAFYQRPIIFPYGNAKSMHYTVPQIGALIRKTRKSLRVTQRELALTSGTGLRFVIDLEKGKETCEFGKALTVLQTLGMKLTLTPPAVPKEK